MRAARIDIVGWWFPPALNADAQAILAALKRNDLKTQLWVAIDEPAPAGGDQAARVAAAVEQLRPVVAAAAAQGCSVGLYNHGGWFGEPENQLAIIAALDAPNVGMVYNLHHGHEHLDRFEVLLPKMLPHLYAINLNGMDRGGDRVGRKILPVGQGELDAELLRIIHQSGYRGPIGIIGHTQDDAELRLKDNLDGLDWFVGQFEGQRVRPRPTPRTPIQ
jgi:sugar phosphate isomerase/epimerase